MPKPNHPTNPDITLVSGEFWGRNPHEEMLWMRDNAPLYWDESSGVWGVASYALVKDISTRPDVFSSAGGIRPNQGPLPMMIDMDDPAHWQRRKLVNKGFTPKRVRDQEAKIAHVVDELIDTVCERGECDLVWDLAAWLPLVMIGDALGFAVEDRPALLKWSDDMMGSLVGGDDSTAVTKAMDAFVGYTEYAGRLATTRRVDPTDDLMSVLVHAEVDGDRLELDEIVHESLLILIGGDETTRHVMSGGAYQLFVHPDQQARLTADPSLIPTAVEEMLRWVTPIKNMCRTATQDVEIAGQVVEEGEELMLLYPSANRDADVFPEPFRFDSARTPNEHVAFGFGAHFCLGASLARLEAKVFFERLLDRLPDIRLAGGNEPAHRPANFVSGYESLPVVFTPAKPSAQM